MVKHFSRSFMLGLRQSTWNGSKPRFAHFEAARQFLLRKMRRQGVKSTSSTREARLLTPKFARSNSNTAFAKAGPAAKAFPVENAKTKTMAHEMVQSAPREQFPMLGVKTLLRPRPSLLNIGIFKK
jgi:hypothetical protein